MTKICIAGKNNIAVDAVAYLVNELNIAKNDIFVIPNNTDDGIDGWQKSLIKYAYSNDIKTTSLDNIYEIEDLIFISLEFDKIVKTEKFKTYRLFNIHFSYLPSYKGMFTSVFPLLKGETKSGVTLHLIDNGIDTGDIVAQYPFDIDLQCSSRELYLIYIESASILFKNNILNILNGNYLSIPQPLLYSSYFSKASIDFNNIKIDLNKTSFEIHNQLRAFIFPEYQLPTINNKKIIKSIITEDKSKRKVLTEYNDFFIITGIDGFVIKAYKEMTD